MLKELDTQVLSRFFELEGEHLSPEKARLVLSLELPAADYVQVEKLGEKANEGTLNDEEREQYESYVRVADMIAILKVRARLALKKLSKSA